MDWEIAGKAGACAACLKHFAEEEELCSALYDESTAFSRRDYCIPCWDSSDRGPVFSYWRSRVPKKDAPVKQMVGDDVLMDLFRRLEGAEEEGRKNFRFVIALLLMRKKTLKFVELKRDGAGSVLVLHDRVSDSRCEVRDPGLNEEQIQRVTEEVNQLLTIRPPGEAVSTERQAADNEKA